ncbi:hypothetical protein [Psychroserpens sp. SPM9]|uniref:hypothetical protein n=1 Tax=Psychroserpens sp. SPM9 TaxID=2975598 RepID=UPI0021A8644B|nr:hypothetical protein [Psychroserpens sp. SPM9]MDG5492308.1 hypothetical protein [Psychroserpens sp. SPM9]
MKYISFIDQLNIDIDQLAHINSDGIIKLQKQLKAKAMLGDANNLGEVANLIEKLKDENTRQCHVFVEKHKWLKQLISGDYEDIKQGEVEVNESDISNLDHLKYFLSPFLKENLKVFLSETLNKGKYVLLLKVLTHNYLFSEEINQLIINFFKARLNYAIVYLNEGRQKDKEYPVGFITNKVFINCLNVYPDCFNEEIQELNSEVIDIYNAKRRNVDNQEFKFMAKAMVAFAVLDTSNVFLKQMLESNADIARQYTRPSRSSRKTGSGFGGWSVFVVIMIFIRIIFWIGKSSNSSPDYDYIRSGDFSIEYNDDMRKIVDSIRAAQNPNDIFEVEETSTNSQFDRYKLEDHIKFIYTLKRKVERKDSEDGYVKPLYAFSNPYPTTFNEIPNTTNINDNNYLNISNRSEQDLIVFRLKQGIDQSIYIPKNEKLSVEVVANDSLVFYTGRDFVATDFSHFKTHTDLTNMFRINSFDPTKEKQITIYPFENKITKVNSSSSNKVIIDTTRKERVVAKNIQILSIDINDLYTDYYKKHYARN